MNRERLQAILNEKKDRPEVFAKSGPDYFIEALPQIQTGIEIDEANAAYEKKMVDAAREEAMKAIRELPKTFVKAKKK
jgi:hypothetical protein